MDVLTIIKILEFVLNEIFTDNKSENIDGTKIVPEVSGLTKKIQKLGNHIFISQHNFLLARYTFPINRRLHLFIVSKPSHFYKFGKRK